MTDFGNVKNTMAAWQEGVSLEDATDLHGDNPEARRLLRNARGQERNIKASQQHDRQRVQRDWIAVFDIIPTHLEPLQARMAARQSRLQVLLSLLKTGEIVALGFAIHDLRVGEPVQIPAFMFDAKFADLKRSSFNGHGRHYAEVRICTVISQPGVINSSKPKPGRPTMSADIDAAIFALREAGIDLSGPPWKSATKFVRERGLMMGLRSFVGEKPAAETIRRRLITETLPQNS